MDTEFSSRAEDTRNKPGGSARWSCRSAQLQRRDGQSCALLPRRTSQFDPVIDKERKFISNLGGNLPVLPDSPECTAIKADMKADMERFSLANKHTQDVTRLNRTLCMIRIDIKQSIKHNSSFKVQINSI